MLVLQTSAGPGSRGPAPAPRPRTPRAAPPWITGIVASLVGVAAGYALGRWNGHGPSNGGGIGGTAAPGAAGETWDAPTSKVVTPAGDGKAAAGSDGQPLRYTPRTGRSRSQVDQFLEQFADPASVDGDRAAETASGMNAEEVRAALDRIRELEPGPARAGAEAILTRRWAQMEPLKALEWIGSVAEPLRRHDLKHEAIRGWAAAEPMQALVYAEMNPDGFLGDYRIRDVFEGVKSADTETAMAFLDQLDTSKYGEAAADIVWTHFGRDRESVLAKIDSLPDGDLRRMSVDRVIDHWARYDPVAAKAWMETHTMPDNRLTAQIELGESWARVDPRAAVQWYTQLPSDQQSAKILDRIVGRWLQYEPETGIDWLRSQPVSPALDNPRTDRARRLAGRDPVEAMLWAGTISDVKRRAATEEHVAWEWYRRDRTAAVDYVLNQSTLSESSRRRFAERAQHDARAAQAKK